MYIFAEHYVNKESNEQTARWIIEHGYDDYTITADSAEPKSVNDHREMGLPVTGAVKRPGVDRTRHEVAQRRRIIIDPVRCRMRQKNSQNTNTNGTGTEMSSPDTRT